MVTLTDPAYVHFLWIKQNNINKAVPIMKKYAYPFSEVVER